MNMHQPVLACHWCLRHGDETDATRSVRLINGTAAGICDYHLTTAWADDQIREIEK